MLQKSLPLLFLLLALSANADQLLVDKREFVTEDFTTFGGTTLPEVRVGWEAYGELNEDRSNVILITHFFSGTSHAAGRYHPDDPEPGYWDAIIGPGKAIDTDRFYVISADTLVNANVHDEQVITTGPASINPETGQAWGSDFPVVTIRDFVEVQRRLLDSLGIERLHAVIGASMGSFQALEWAVTYPERVERMVSAIGAARMGPWEVALLESWARPIRLDPNWRAGRYYGQERPLDGLTTSLMQITLNALHPDFFDRRFPQHDNLTDRALAGIDSGFAVTDWLEERARQRALVSDANHILYLVRASQLFIAGHDGDLDSALERVQARTLFLPAEGDLLLRPQLARDAHRQLEAAGANSRLQTIPGPMGHLNGVAGIAAVSDTLADFLAD
ncbi:homoserine O-acetyltransferase [Wenzhouxiangella sp. XN201]|uniref:E22 family MetX-like putative esterase n=1 Tax=Wenzhouxiangella sp. XN201 TaxID=2710755 RepID=UPI0013C675D2|nr:homoserine O-acetyltransferase [Wenzhouxiangella sp. XN201]NEZ04025.1 homoserine O-acetyltransferase [Wenzhouxiangella sp. XN201]